MPVIPDIIIVLRRIIVQLHTQRTGPIIKHTVHLIITWTHHIPVLCNMWIKDNFNKNIYQQNLHCLILILQLQRMFFSSYVPLREYRHSTRTYRCIFTIIYISLWMDAMFHVLQMNLSKIILKYEK